jgi:hypothetical protein
LVFRFFPAIQVCETHALDVAYGPIGLGE